MKKLLIVLLSVFILTGCGSGVSQEEYDKIAAERDEYKEKSEFIEKNLDLEKKVIEYRTAIDKDYEKIQALFNLYDALEIKEADEIKITIDETYKKAIDSIDAIKSMYDSISSYSDMDFGSDTEKTIDEIYDSWNILDDEFMKTYNKLINK